MNAEERAKIRARLDKATPGPWYMESRGRGREMVFVTGEFCSYNVCDSSGAMDTVDADFITHSRTDMETLLDALDEFSERVRRAVDECEKDPDLDTRQEVVGRILAILTENTGV